MASHLLIQLRTRERPMKTLRMKTKVMKTMTTGMQTQMGQGKMKTKRN